MAEKKSPARGADFVDKIVKDPKNPPDTVMLSGYLGASSEDGHTRLYFDPSLGSYVEIPDDAILHTEPVEGDSLGARRVWINRGAEFIYGPAGSQRPKGTFLDGPIMQAHLGAAAPQPIPPSDFVPCQSWICPPTPNCPKSDFAPCQSWICPPSPHCPPVSNLLGCVTIGGCQLQSAQCPPTPQCPPVSNPVGCVTIGGCPVQPNAGGAEAAAAPAARAMGTLFHCPSPPIICNAPAHTPILPCISQGCTAGPPLCPKTPVLPCVTQQCTVMPQCVTAPPANCQHTPVMPCLPTPHFACPSIHPGCPTFHWHGPFVC
jgi:hypothetical protein